MLQAWKATTQTQKAGCLMDRDQKRKHLAQADRHITEVKKHIHRSTQGVQLRLFKTPPSPEALPRSKSRARRSTSSIAQRTTHAANPFVTALSRKSSRCCPKSPTDWRLSRSSAV